jgi:hypothetical protein
MKRKGLTASIILIALILALLQTSVALGSQSDPSANADDAASQTVIYGAKMIDIWENSTEIASSGQFWSSASNFSFDPELDFDIVTDFKENDIAGIDLSNFESLSQTSLSKIWQFLRSATIKIENATGEYKNAFFSIEFFLINNVFEEVYAPYLKI